MPVARSKDQPGPREKPNEAPIVVAPGQHPRGQALLDLVDRPKQKQLVGPGTWPRGAAPEVRCKRQGIAGDLKRADALRTNFELEQALESFQVFTIPHRSSVLFLAIQPCIY